MRTLLPDDCVEILERWTRTEGWRKVGDGPWEPIDLSLWGGQVPVIFLKTDVDEIVQTKLQTKHEATLKGYLMP